MVLSIKHEGTSKELWEARFIVQGQRDKIKDSVVNDILVARQYAIKLLVCIATIFGFSLFSTDVTRAYIQSSEALNCHLFVTPPK